MNFAPRHSRFSRRCRSTIILAGLLLFGSIAAARSYGQGASPPQQSQQNPSASQENSTQDKPADSKKDAKPSDPTTTKLRIHVTAADKPVSNASVYVRFPVAGGLFHKEKLSELNLKDQRRRLRQSSRYPARKNFNSSRSKGLEDVRQVVRRRYRRAHSRN